MKKSLTYLNFDDACKKSIEIANPISKTEVAYTFDSLGKVVSKDIICKKNLPSFNNSAMDGVACRVEDSGKVLKIVDTIFAGDKKDFKDLNIGECYKIMTGAKVPSCVEVIIPIENCIQIDSFSVEVPKNLKLNSFINHINGIKDDNRVENLEWCTSVENLNHALDNNLRIMPNGEKHHKSKLTEVQVLEIRNSDLSQKELTILYNVKQPLISAIINRKKWKHI